jgi:hypothetical protein
MVAGGSVHETIEEVTRRRQQAVLLARYVASTDSGMSPPRTPRVTPRAGLTRSLSADDVGTVLHAPGDSLSRRKMRNLTKYFSSLRSTYRRGLDDILGRRSEDNDDEDWGTLLMVEQLKASVPKPKPKASSGPLTQVQQKKSQESSTMLQRREFGRSFKLASDAVLGEDILMKRKQKTKSQFQWSRIRVTTKLAAAVAEQ